MKNKPMLLQPALILILVLILAACKSESEELTSTATEPAGAVELTQAAQTVIAQLTRSAAAGWTPTLSPPPETNTPTLPPPTPTGPTLTPSETPLPTTTPLPTITSTPTLVPGDPRGELGAPDWQADFSLESDWYTFDGENASILMWGGNLVLTAKSTDIFEIWSLSYPFLADFYLEYTILTGQECQGRDRYGMVARAPDPDEGYLFGVSCDGAFRLLYWDGEEFTTLRDWTESKFINTGPGVFNRLGIEAVGEKLSLYVNGGLVAEVEDDRLAEGKFGAFIKGENTAGFRVTISDVLYWELP
ncbi:MAG: hypothetical protein FJ010_05850 [Chloroflexi bacterium]|nr:hypothetical protein [Chloroflexota bacterium]